MATDKQIAANRRNSENSTGPKSGSGKAISSRNALKTGIDIASELMRVESKTDFDQLETEYYEDFAPANAIERALIDQLIRNEWILRRYAAVEPGVWHFRFQRNKNEDLGDAFVDASATFLRLDRIRNSAQRNYARALKELKALREERNADIPVREPAQPKPLESLTSELGSFHTFPQPPQPPAEIDPPDDEAPPIAA